jgi:hypothetical protein
MIAALIRAALPFLLFPALILLAREAFLRWEARRTWQRYKRAARAHHASCQFLDDRRPRTREAEDATFEDVRR